ncbi:dynamin family protein [Pelovirga terrestris]|uniref:Dynamin family protein n=1 Tax=Pelovirga terrestris TaxID=2771352 RepID=A0A8J6QQM6_9BACT|nr:dynamin family protein [Pelovirga terrestris]MBD1401351.1 dynamin family protein [Pelovirga terrestris]
MTSDANITLDAIIDRTLDALAPIDPQQQAGDAPLQALRARQEEGTFRLAVLGQFKRGKSTFLNALLGADLLPTDILPVTAIPTFIGADDSVTARVFFFNQTDPVRFEEGQDGSFGDFLQAYVTEAGNPDNHRQVERVEIGHPAAILKQGVVLIDTPGIGSTFKHNTEVAYQILPHCDAALFLVSPDPPITEAEIAYLREVRELLPRTFFLLNKVDFLSEKDKVVSLTFLADQLKPLFDGAPQVLPLSAKNGLTARLTQDKELWKSSGMYQVEQNLIDFFAREKQQILELSLRRRVKDQLNTQIMHLQLSLEALRLPELDLKKRITMFEEILPAIEREKQSSADVLAGDLKRIVTALTQQIEALRSAAKQRVMPKVEGVIQEVADTEELERQVRAIVANQLPIFFAPALRQVDDAIRRQATEILSLHQKRAEQLIEQVRKAAAELFNVPYHAPLVERVYAHFDPPGWSQDLFISDMDPIGQKISRKLMTKRFRHRRTVQRLREQTQKLLNENTEQMNWALRRGLDESFRRYGSELDEQLDKIIAATRAAMDIALQKKSTQHQQLEDQLALLERTITELQALAQQCLAPEESN